MKHILSIFLLLALLCVAQTLARDFTVATLSDTNAQARGPVISATGMVAWQQYDSNPTDGGLLPSDIYSWKDGVSTNRTKNDARIGGKTYRPYVFDDSIVFPALFPPSDTSGFPFQLSIPPKNQGMQAMEQEYPSLFEPPTSALESEIQDTTAEEATQESNVTNLSQALVVRESQNWRSSGKGEDVVLCSPDGSIQRITPGNRHYNSPVGSASGLAFLCARGWPYGYEMVVWKPGDSQLTQITTNYYYVLNPNVHGNELVYQAWDGMDYEIYLYDFSTGANNPVTSNPFDDLNPVVWNGSVAWVANPTVNPEIFLYEEGRIIKISTDSTENAAPSIWNGRVVWQGLDTDGDLEIYYFDGRRTIKLTSNAWDDIAPKICDGVIVWSSYVDNWDAEVMALDLSDNITFRLTDNDYEDIAAQTANEKVVWQTILPEASVVQLATPVAPREGNIP